MNQSETPSRGSGLAGSLKVIAAMAILALALLGALLVLEVIPQSMFQELLGKTMLLVLIAACTTAALWVVVRPGKQ